MELNSKRLQKCKTKYQTIISKYEAIIQWKKIPNFPEIYIDFNLTHLCRKNISKKDLEHEISVRIYNKTKIKIKTLTKIKIKIKACN